jgi:hypothetical protein
VANSMYYFVTDIFLHAFERDSRSLPDIHFYTEIFCMCVHLHEHLSVHSIKPVSVILWNSYWWLCVNCSVWLELESLL